MKKMIALIALLALAGCFQTYNDENDLNTVPVTNNPHILPSHGSMMGGSPQ